MAEDATLAEMLFAEPVHDHMEVYNPETGERTRVAIADAYARAKLANIGGAMYPVGVKITSSIPLDPHLLFGGVWVLLSYHNFRKEYIYEKISEDVPEADDTESKGEA